MTQSRFLGVAVLGFFLVGGLLADDKKETPVRPGRALPANWSKLGLSSDQKDKLYKIRADHRAKAEDLERQLKELKKQERTEMEAVLTDAQKARLREILSEKAPPETKPESKAPPTTGTKDFSRNVRPDPAGQDSKAPPTTGPKDVDKKP